MSDEKRETPSTVPLGPKVFIPPKNLRSPQHRIIYANGFAFSFSPADFGVTFLAPVPGQFGPQQMEEITVYMTLTTLKTISDHLAAVTKVYEEELGDIKITKVQKVADAHLDNLKTMLKDNKLE